MKKRALIVVCGMMFALVSVAQAQWVNPNTNAGTTQVALMLSSNGTVIAPTVVEGLTEFSASLGQIDALSSDTITLPKGGTTIEDWTDIDALLTDDISIEYGANYGTEPEPKGEIYRGKSGNALQMKPLIGVGGITVTDTTEAVYISGDATNGLDALFPVPTNTLYGAFYARGPTPHAMQRISVVNTTNGLLWWNGTNWMLAGSAPAPQATNAALFNGQSAAWWRDMNNHSNMWVFDDGAVQGTITKGFEFGDYLDVTTVVRTNNSREYTLYRINAAGTNVPSNLASSNYWTEWNGFEDDLHLWGRVIVHGQGSANAGQGATVGLGGTNNSASGDYSTVGGGRVNVASGTDSTIAGGVLNDATATGATVAGGRDNEVSGLYSTSIGGWDNDITGQYSGLGGEYNDMSGNLGLGWGVYLGITNHYNYVFGGGQATTNRLTPKVPYAAVFYRYGETMKLGVNVETPTNEVHVLGTVQATDFVGDGSLLTGITAAGGVTNKLVSADGTTYTITNNPSASDVLKIDTATTSAWFSADNDTGAASGMTNQIVSLDGTVYNITNNPTDGQIIAIDASTTSAWFTADSGSGSGGMTNQIVSLDGTIFTITNNPALGDIIHIDTSTTSAWFAADGGASASGMTNQIVSLDGTIFTITNNPTDGQIIAVDASTTSAWFTAESDPLSAKTNDPISIFSNDSGYATRLGETNALNWTNAVHVRVPLTPASAYDAVSKDYADNQAAAAVTNAVDRASFNGGGLQTGLTTLDFVSDIFTNIALAGGTGRVQALNLADIQDGGGAYKDVSGNITATNGNNAILAGTTRSMIAAGVGNTISNSAHAFIGGGTTGVIESANWGFIGGGWEQEVTALYGSVVGGIKNKAQASRGFVGGGQGNTVASGGDYGGILAGLNSTVSGDRSWAGGGDGHTVSGDFSVGLYGLSSIVAGDYSLAGGNGSQAAGDYSVALGLNAQPSYDKTFMYSDGTAGAVSAAGTNTFNIVAERGLVLYKGQPPVYQSSTNRLGIVYVREGGTNELRVYFEDASHFTLATDEASAYLTSESDPLSVKTNDPLSIFVDDVGYMTRQGETNMLNLTNAVHVRVPLTPANAYDAVSKDYADNLSAAAVTNAVDRALFNGGGLQAGLTALDFVSDIFTNVALDGGTGRVQALNLADIQDGAGVILRQVQFGFPKAVGTAVSADTWYELGVWMTNASPLVISGDPSLFSSNDWSFAFPTTGVVVVDALSYDGTSGQDDEQIWGLFLNDAVWTNYSSVTGGDFTAPDETWAFAAKQDATDFNYNKTISFSFPVDIATNRFKLRFRQNGTTQFLGFHARMHFTGPL